MGVVGAGFELAVSAGLIALCAQGLGQPVAGAGAQPGFIGRAQRALEGFLRGVGQAQPGQGNPAHEPLGFRPVAAVFQPVALGEAEGEVEVLILQRLPHHNVPRAPFLLRHPHFCGDAEQRCLSGFVLALCIQRQHLRHHEGRVAQHVGGQGLGEAAIAAAIGVHRFGEGEPVGVQIVVVAAGVRAFAGHQQEGDPAAPVFGLQQLAEGGFKGALVVGFHPAGRPLVPDLGRGCVEIAGFKTGDQVPSLRAGRDGRVLGVVGQHLRGWTGPGEFGLALDFEGAGARPVLVGVDEGGQGRQVDLIQRGVGVV